MLLCDKEKVRLRESFQVQYNSEGVSAFTIWFINATRENVEPTFSLISEDIHQSMFTFIHTFVSINMYLCLFV